MEKNNNINTLIISEYNSFKNNIEAFISTLDNKDLICNYADSINEYKDNKYNILIINKKEYTIDDIKEIINLKNDLEIILIVSSTDYKKIYSNVYKYGIFVIKRPVAFNVFLEIIKICIFNYNKRINNKSIKYILDIAKALLISNLNMNENEAHKYLERKSMDLRCPIDKICEEIISNELKVELI